MNRGRKEQDESVNCCQELRDATEARRTVEIGQDFVVQAFERTAFQQATRGSEHSETDDAAKQAKQDRTIARNQQFIQELDNSEQIAGNTSAKRTS